MPHTNSVLVIHPDGTFYAQRKQVAHIPESKRGYWRDRQKTVLVLFKSTDDQPTTGYEYGGKKSYDPHAIALRQDRRTGLIVETTSEHIDRTLIPVRDAGGAKVLQLKPMHDRRTTGQHVPRHDRLWRPERSTRDNASSDTESVRLRRHR